MALDFTCLHAFHAKRRASSSSSVGARFVTTLRDAGVRTCRSLPWRRSPPLTFFISYPVSPPQRKTPPVSMRRRLGLAERTLRASLSYDGAITASKKVDATSLAVSPFTARLNPMTPPYAETGAHSLALSKAPP